MKERILELLVCPFCGGDLSLESLKKEKREVRIGVLKCVCGQWFPIIDFIPRLLLDEYRGDYEKFINTYGLYTFEKRRESLSQPFSKEKQVQESFGSKWMSHQSFPK